MFLSHGEGQMMKTWDSWGKKGHIIKHWEKGTAKTTRKNDVKQEHIWEKKRENLGENAEPIWKL